MSVRRGASASGAGWVRVLSGHPVYATALRFLLLAAAALLVPYSPGAHAASSCDSATSPLSTGALTTLNAPVPGGTSGQTIALDYLFFQPADTGDSISCSTANTQSAGLHYAVIPRNCVGCSATPTAVVFIGGSGSIPGSYADISNRAAAMGYAVLDLAYVETNSGKTGLNDKTAGSVCGYNVPLTDMNRCSATDTQQTTAACFTEYHGEVVFGRNTSYIKLTRNPKGTDHLACNRVGSGVHVTKYDSVMNRIVAALDYLAHDPALPAAEQAYWKNFLVSNKNSPYVPASSKTSSKPWGLGAYPDWSKIILAGHSQGGGNAAYLAMNIDNGATPLRVNLFSSPQDSQNTTTLKGTVTTSADWIGMASSTPMSHYWGFRDYDEGVDPVIQIPLGDMESTNWSLMGGTGSGGVGGTSTGNDMAGGAEFSLADPSGVKANGDGRCLGPLTTMLGQGFCVTAWTGQQRYVSQANGNMSSGDLTANHDSTAVGCSTIASDSNCHLGGNSYTAGTVDVWDVMFSMHPRQP